MGNFDTVTEREREKEREREREREKYIDRLRDLRIDR